MGRGQAISLSSGQQEDIIADLLASNQSIALNLEEWRKKVKTEPCNS